MSSLATCIKRAGKALSPDDATTIRQIHDDLAAAGVANPAEQAVAEFLGGLETERATLVNQIKDQGGRVPKDGLVLAKQREREIAEAISIVALLDGEEILDIPEAKITKAGKLRATAKNLALALVARAKKANRGRALDSMTPRSKEILSEVLAIETEAAIRRTGNAGDWYTAVLQNAVNIVAEMHPELKTDQDARTMFMLGLAITSNGQEVYANSVTAEEVYAHFKKTGKFPLNEYGNQGAAMSEAFSVSNQLIDRWGLDMFARFLNTEFTVGELKQLGFNIQSEPVEFKTHGSIIFGPKVGGGFFQNLMGNYDPITMDRWFMRTWGRLTGTLMPDQTQLPEAAATRFTEEIRANPDKVEALGWTVDRALENEGSLMEFAKVVHRAYAKSSSKHSKTYGEKTAFNKSGKNLDIAMNQPIIAPTSGAQRMWIREVAALALEKLQQRGLPVNGASMQALVWYPEKDLYIKHGVGNAKSAPTDYEKEFARIALDRGIPKSRVDAARTGNTAERPAGDARDDGRDTGPGRSANEAADAAGLGRSERTRLLQFEAVRRIREQLPRAYRGSVPTGAERLVEGVHVVRRHKPQVRTRNTYNKVGLATPMVLELEQSEAAAALYHAKISAAANANKAGAAVYVYDQAEYEGMRTFLTPDGLSGFALKDDDIVSVFKHPKSQDPGVAQALIALAVSEGGRRLDAFDTVLPTLYSMQGFRVASRMEWNEEFAPPAWDKDTFGAFNDGEPDVVYMVYDKNRPDAYTGQNEGQMVTDYDEAVRIQEEAVAALEARNRPDIQFALPKRAQDRINRDPRSPLSRLHKMGAVVEEQANLPRPSKWRNWLGALQPTAIKSVLLSVPRRYLADFLPGAAAPALQKYLRLAGQLDGRRNSLHDEYEVVTRKWAQWANAFKEKAAMLGDIMHAATLYGVDPSKDYRPLKKPENMTMADKRMDAARRAQHRLMAAALDRLGPEAREIFNEVRDSYSLMRARVDNALEERINASEADEKTKKAMIDLMRKKMEAGRVQGVYFPLMRYGEYWAVAKSEPDAEGNQEIISFARFENRGDQREWTKAFREEGYQIQQGVRGSASNDVIKSVDPRFAARVAQLVGGIDGGQEIAEAVWQTYLMTLPEMSIRKQFMRRKGRLGFSADALRAYATVSYRNANQLAKLEYMHRMDNSLGELEDEVVRIQNDPKMDKDFHWAGAMLDELKERHAAQQNPDASTWAITATGAGFLWFLGFTPAAAAVNLTQTALVGFPVISAEFNPVGASKELALASKLWGTSRGKLSNRLRGDERLAMEEAEKIGMFDRTQAHDLAGVTEAGATGTYGGWQATTMRWGAYMFHKMEQMNREVTFLAGYRLARQRGDSHADAVTVAEKLTWDSHFDYNNANRPRFMQSDWGRVIFLFKQYSLNMAYRMMRDFRDGVMRNKDIPVAERNKAAQRFVGMMTMSFMFSGLSGLPTFLTFIPQMVAELFLGDEDEPFDSEVALRAHLVELFGETAADVIMHGPVDRLSGATVSTRVALNELFIRDQHVSQATGKDVMRNYVVDALGPVLGTAVEWGGVAYDLQSGEVTAPLRALEMATPKAVRDVMRAHRFATEGARTKHVPSGEIVSQEDMNARDIFWQLVGFTPAKVTDAYQQAAAWRNMSQPIIRRRSQLTERMALAVFEDDKKEQQEILEEIERFNQANPTYPINGLGESIRARAIRDAMSKKGVTLPRQLWHLYDEYTFTDEELPED